MIGIELRVKQVEGISPAYAEAYGQWTVNTPVTKDELERFVEEMDKAKETLLPQMSCFLLIQSRD